MSTSCEVFMIEPKGKTVDPKYPLSLEELDRKMRSKKEKASLKDAFIKHDDQAIRYPVNLVNELLDKKKPPNETVLPDVRFHDMYRSDIRFDRGDLGLSIYHSVPASWKKSERQLGYANDDLVNAYMMLLSKVNPQFRFRTQQDLHVIVDKLNVGSKGIFIDDIAEYQFKKERALFKNSVNGKYWKEVIDKPSTTEIPKTTLPKKMRSDLLNEKFEFDESDLKDLTLPDEGYVAIETKAEITHYYSITHKPEPQYRHIVFPVHKEGEGHWALIHIDFENFTIQHFDSLYFSLDLKYFVELQKYIKSSLKLTYPTFDSRKYMKRFSNIDYSKSDPKVTPKQQGVDCGFFIMEMAKYLALGWKITSSTPNKKDMANIRRRCVYELHQYCLLKV